MLFAYHADEDDKSILVLPAGSVRSFFMRSGRGTELFVDPGPLAFPELTDRVREDVRAAVLIEAGRVLNVPPSDVLSLVQRNPWASRKRTRGLFVGYSR